MKRTRCYDAPLNYYKVKFTLYFNIQCLHIQNTRNKCRNKVKKKNINDMFVPKLFILL